MPRKVKATVSTSRFVWKSPLRTPLGITLFIDSRDRSEVFHVYGPTDQCPQSYRQYGELSTEWLLLGKRGLGVEQVSLWECDI